MPQNILTDVSSAARPSDQVIPLVFGDLSTNQKVRFGSRDA